MDEQGLPSKMVEGGQTSDRFVQHLRTCSSARSKEYDVILERFTLNGNRFVRSNGFDGRVFHSNSIQSQLNNIVPDESNVIGLDPGRNSMATLCSGFETSREDGAKPRFRSLSFSSRSRTHRLRSIPPANLWYNQHPGYEYFISTRAAWRRSLSRNDYRCALLLQRYKESRTEDLVALLTSQQTNRLHFRRARRKFFFIYL